MRPAQRLLLQSRIWLALLATLLLTWLAYRPGLSGEFLFDDFVNLNALGSSGPIDNWPGFWRFLTSGTADPGGRPLSLLSFLLDARDWPADPRPFLTTNLILHLLNGCLLFELLRRLGRAVNNAKAQADVAALLAAGLWLLHPLFVSTTLYAVQREAMLPASAVLAGLLAFFIGRQRFGQTDGKSGAGWMVAGITLGTAVAVLCKANGILLPVLALTVDWTIFRTAGGESLGPEALRRLARLRTVLLLVPSVLLAVYVGSFLLHWNDPLADRPWTIGQRVLTEPRVVLDYLQALAVPSSSSAGIYNDGYTVSTSLWHPVSTLPALLFIFGLIGAGVGLRKRAPVVSAAVLFFFAGHALESTAIPLELYFEHRNYLPSLLLFWPLALAICSFPAAKWLRVAVALSVLALLGVTTWQRSALWGQTPQLKLLWLSQNPNSSRALANVAIDLTHSGRADLANALLAPKWQQRPYDAQLAVNFLDSACAWRGVTPPQIQAMSRLLLSTREDGELVLRWLGEAIQTARAGRCAGLRIEDVATWIDAADKNSALGRASAFGARTLQLRGRLAVAMDEPETALRYFDQALVADNQPDVALRQAAMLASGGYYAEGLAQLDRYERIKTPAGRAGPGMPWLHANVLEWQAYWPQEMAWMRAVLKDKIHARETSKAR